MLSTMVRYIPLVAACLFLQFVCGVGLQHYRNAMRDSVGVLDFLGCFA